MRESDQALLSAEAPLPPHGLCGNLSIGSLTFLRITLPPLLSPLLDLLLAQRREAASALETRVQHQVGIHQPPRDRLNHLEDLHRVTHILDLLFAEFEDRQRDAEERFRPFVEEGVPDPERGLDGQGADEAGHEPGCGAERDWWETHRYFRVKGRAVQLAADLRPDRRHGFADREHQDAEVDVGDRKSVV